MEREAQKKSEEGQEEEDCHLSEDAVIMERPPLGIKHNFHVLEEDAFPTEADTQLAQFRRTATNRGTTPNEDRVAGQAKGRKQKRSIINCSRLPNKAHDEKLEEPESADWADPIPKATPAENAFEVLEIKN